MVRQRWWLVALAVVAAAAILIVPGLLVASDHDDGETDTKGRNVNITDVYAFREGDQNSAASPNDLILIMNVNPRSVARQQYYFSTNARYEIKIERAANVNAAPTAAGLSTPDVTLRFTFGAPDANRRQQITLTAVRDGTEVVADAGTTTALNDSPIMTPVSAIGSTGTLFAGLRQDPFFFDVEQFFRVRAGALGIGPAEVFRHPGIDFTWGYNVLSIVVRIPVTYLQHETGATTFDVWTTVSVPTAAGFTQVERLAQPAINEGLIVTNDFLNALNSVGPEVEAAFLEGTLPPAFVPLVTSIVTEARNTLLAFGNPPARADALLAAFLPDVLRIDVNGLSGYAAAVNSAGRPSRGRMIMDDVIDTTLSVIVPGKNPQLQSDNVNYFTPAPIGVTGHKALLPTFPYLVAPN